MANLPTGSYTAIGSEVAPGVGTAIGAGLDVASLVAGGIGEAQMLEEKMKLELRRQGLDEAQINAKLNEMRRKRQRREALGKALAKMMPRGGM